VNYLLIPKSVDVNISVNIIEGTAAAIRRVSVSQQQCCAGTMKSGVCTVI